MRCTKEKPAGAGNLAAGLQSAQTHSIPKATEAVNTDAVGLVAPFQRLTDFPTGVERASLGRTEAAAVLRACEGIEAIAAVLYQREIDAEIGGGLSLGHVTASGLLSALGCCAQLIADRLHAARKPEA